MTFPKIEELRQLISPMLTLGPPDADTQMGKTVGEGLKLPDAETLIQQWFLKVTVDAELDDTLGWIRSVIRPEWIVDDVSERLCAAHKAANGQDAFIGAWTVRNRVFQIVVTRERLHWITRIPDARPAATDTDKVAKALTLAFAFFQLRDKLDPGKFQVRQFGGLTLAYLETPFAGNWPETLLLLTDGSAVKYSVLKYKDKSGPTERGSASREYVPWFPKKL